MSRFSLFVFLIIFVIVEGSIDFVGQHYAKIRVKRDGRLSTRWISRKGGVDIPISLRSLITCTTPGINDVICLGPRVGLFEPKEITLTKKQGSAFGYNNGVDLRLLGPAKIPLIYDDTEIGVHDGATVRWDGVEFGHQRRIFKLWRDNTGGVVEWGPRGVGVDVGYRGSAADDLIGVQYTIAGINVGNPSQGLAAPPLIPGPRVPSPTSLYRPSNIARLYPGGRIQPDYDSYYRQKFRNFGDEYRTPKERACPWCFAAPLGK